MELLNNLPARSLPGPAPLPLIGRHANVLRFFRDPIGTLTHLHARYGDVAALSGGDASWVAVSGAERLRQVLSDSNAFHNLADSPVPVPTGSAPDVLFGKSLTAINGEAHRRARRLMQPIFAKAAVAAYQSEMSTTAQHVVDTWRAGDHDVVHLSMELVLLIAMKSLFGVDPGDEAAHIGQLSKAFLEGVLSPGVLLLPFDLPGSPYARWMKACAAYRALLRRMVSERRAGGMGKRDVLSTLIGARDEDGSQLAEEELVAHAAVLLTASHETSANTIAWTLLLLATHPNVYRDLEDELHSKLAGAAPTVDQLAQLPLLDRVVKESQRLLPAAPILFFRAAQAPFSIGGHDLPAGTRVLLSPYLAHRNPAMYEMPLRFVPARWERIEPTIYQYMPFGAGPRLCLGAQFAAQAIRTALAVILARFRFETIRGARVDRLVRGITLGAKDGIMMRLTKPRNDIAEPKAIRGDVHSMVEGLPT